MSEPVRTGSTVERPVTARYDALARQGTLDPDPQQKAIAARLDRLVATLGERRLARKATPLGWLFGKRAEAEPAPRGLYVWGEVGRGKTMLMDLFFEALPIEKKRRAHFHAYMADVHERIHAYRQKLKSGEVQGDDPIRPVASQLADEASVLCFDEFAVTDIADAMLLGRLFTVLFERGVTVVATSNVPPDGLYKDGLNRALFLPFIDLLQERMEVMRLDSRTDYRMEKIGDAPVYFTPLDLAATASLDDMFRRLTGGAPAKPAELTIHGRRIAVPLQAMGVARFSFDDLCNQPLAAADYITVANAYHTVVLDGIPKLHPDQRNQARRFIMLIDVFYERHVKLIASAEAAPDALYHAETGAETFEFARTVSRLTEMQSRDYLSQPQGGGDAPGGQAAEAAAT